MDPKRSIIMDFNPDHSIKGHKRITRMFLNVVFLAWLPRHAEETQAYLNELKFQLYRSFFLYIYFI